MKQHYCLPTGEETTSAERYVNAWRALAKPIQDRLGVRLHSFDPDLRFAEPGGATFDVPVKVAQLIKQLVDLQRNHPFR